MEEPAVTRLPGQELAVVFIALLGISIHPETFPPFVIIVILCGPCPVVALDAEVVVSLSHEVTSSRPALKKSLCQRDAGRNTITEHLLKISNISPIKIAFNAFLQSASFKNAKINQLGVAVSRFIVIFAVSIDMRSQWKKNDDY